MAKEKQGASYTSKNIKTLNYPDVVRVNMGMYIGGSDAYSRWVTVKEGLDNALDEALAKRNDFVWLDVAKDGLVSIIDHGHGIPQGIKKQEVMVNGKPVTSKVETMYAVFGVLSTSGKYDSEAYKTSIGTHGVGIKATNATASTFHVRTCYEGQWYEVSFKRGKLDRPVAKCKAPKDPNGDKMKRGTLIQFRHDPDVFSKFKPENPFPIASAIEWADIMAFLTPGTRILITENGKKKAERYSKEGPKEYVKQRLAKLGTADEPLPHEAQFFTFHNELADVAIAFSAHDSCDLRGYVNGSYTRDGGTHVDAITGALYKGLVASDAKNEKKKEKLSDRVKRAKTARAKAKAKSALKERAFTEADIKEGLVGLVNARLHKAKFNSQDKVKLADERMGKDFEEFMTEEFTKFFENNKAMAARLREKAMRMNELKSKFTASKQAASDINKMKKSGISAKYAPPNKSFKPEDCELFVVEGDSAAGGLRTLRRKNQGLVPLKGKVMNSIRKTADQVLSSDEPLMVLAALGYNPSAKDPIAKLNFGRLILLADPDPDGPFVGDTLIKVRFPVSETEYEVVERPISGLAAPAPWGTVRVGFQVPVLTGGAEQWCRATARHVADVDTLVAMEIGGHKYKVSESHKFVVVRTPATRDRICTQEELAAKGYPDLGDAIAFIEAKNMRIGDRVWCPQLEKERRDYNKQDKATGKGFLAVNKLRVQHLAEKVPVYCLDVPKHHHFILPSGAVSGNCHINTLLLGLIYKFVPELFERGMVYLADAPLFWAKVGSKIFTGDTISEVKKKLKGVKAPQSTKINRIKGWGEVNASMIDMLALNPSTRRLIQVKPLAKEDHTDFIHIMGDDVQMRKKMLGIEVEDGDDKPEQMRGKNGKPQRGKRVKGDGESWDDKPKKGKKAKAKKGAK